MILKDSAVSNTRSCCAASNICCESISGSHQPSSNQTTVPNTSTSITHTLGDTSATHFCSTPLYISAVFREPATKCDSLAKSVTMPSNESKNHVFKMSDLAGTTSVSTSQSITRFVGGSSF